MREPPLPNDVVRDAFRALQLAVAVEVPLALFLLLVGIPTEYRPNVFLMLPSIAHIPGVILFGPIRFDSPLNTLATFRLPIEDVATLAAGNVIVFSLAAFIGLRLWAASCRVADTPRSA